MFFQPVSRRRVAVDHARLLTTTSLALSFLVFGPAGAQDADTAADEGRRSLDEIVVTARKRQESLQDTPISISAFSESALRERNIQSASDIGSFVPNVQFDAAASESGGGASSQISIRGIGQTDYVITVEPAVGLYLDGVYVGKSVGSLLDTIDIERIEVLRGPQGTLFGKNTIGGAIQLISKRPSDEVETDVEVTFGSFDRVDGKLGISGPISDRLRVRLSGAYQSRDGFMERATPTGVLTGETQGNIDRLSGRFVAEYDVASNFLATLSADATHIREQSPAQVLLKANELDFFSSVFNDAVPGGVCSVAAGPSRLTNPYCFNSQYVRPLDSKTTTNSGGNRSDADIFGVGLNLEWTPGDITIRSITAYRDVSSDISQDLQGSPYYFNNVEQHIDQNQFSQEFQLIGDLFNSRLKYVFGLFYMQEEGTQVFPVNLALLRFNSGGDIKNSSYAAFGQLTYDVTDRLSVTGGLRYTNESKKFNPGLQHITGYDYFATSPVPGFVNPIPDIFGPVGTPLFPAGWYKRTSDSATPMASISYKVSDSALAYATFSQGFKAGGFTMRYFPPVQPAPGTDPDDIVSYADPEKATSYEIGLKTDLFDRRLRFNIAGFYTNYDNIQVTYVVDPDGAGPIGAFVPVLANAGRAHNKGIEIESTAILADWLQIDGSLGYLDAKYVSFTPDALANFPNALSLDLPNAPKLVFNTGATVQFFDNGLGRATLRADYSYKGAQFKDFSNDPVIHQDQYGVLNAALTYQIPNREGVQITLGGANLTDKRYIVSGVTSTEYAQAVPSRPREWYLRLRASF